MDPFEADLRVIRCDECGAESHNPADLYLGPDSRWVMVEASEDADHGQFCCWSCLAAWATNRAVEREAFLPEPS